MARAPEAAEFMRDGEITSSISMIDRLFRSGILESPDSAVQMAGVTQTLILLNDLLQKAAMDKVRITFNDHIDPAWGADVTEFVRAMRNAVVHIPSGLRDFEGNRFAFNVIRGYAPRAMIMGDHVIGCDFEDDIAVNYGGMRLYLRRHLLRAAGEVIAALQPMVAARAQVRMDEIRAANRGFPAR